MKVFIALAVLIAVSIAAPADEIEYAHTYDFETLFKNNEQRIALLECVLDKRPCGEFQKLKESIVRLLTTKCAGCNPEHKARHDYIVNLYHDQYEAEFNELMNKIDQQQKQ